MTKGRVQTGAPVLSRRREPGDARETDSRGHDVTDMTLLLLTARLDR